MMLPKESSPTGTNNITQLCLASAFLALIIVTRLVSIMLGPFILGYSLQLHYIPYSLGLIYLKDYKYKLGLFIFAPLILIVFTIGVNPIFDYVLTMYSFFMLLIIKFKDYVIKKQIIILLVVMFFNFNLANLWNVISGVVFYHVTWSYSFVFNAIFNAINFTIITPIFLMSYKIITTYQKNINYEFTN